MSINKRGSQISLEEADKNNENAWQYFDKAINLSENNVYSIN
jgi:hypothetical protein